MAIDTSIYNNIRQPEIESPVNSLARVTQLQNAQNQNKLYSMKVAESERALAGETALNDAYQGALGPDGKIDRNKLFASVAQSGQGAKLPGIQKTFSEQDKAARDAEKAQLETAMQKQGIIAQYAGSAKDQASWTAAKQALSSMGVDVSQVPDQYDPAIAQTLLQRSLTGVQQLEQTWKSKQFDLDVDKFGYQKQNDAANRGVTIRGQNMTDARGREAIDVSRDKLAYDKSKPGKVANMSATMQKELFEADDTAQSSKNVISLLRQAKDLNAKAYSGFGAKERAAVRGQLPGDTTSADATINLDNIMTGQALESLKSVFGGMPTEGERKILLDMQASADKTPTQRAQIMDRAINAAEKRLRFSQSKAKSLRDGTYTTTGPAATEEPNNIDSLLDKYK